MTKISEIHGLNQIPTDEYAGRGEMVGNMSSIPYLSLTRGEMELMLAAQRMKILADWYSSDAPQYQQAYQMLENALHRGVSNGVNFVGAVPHYLQRTAALIKKASKQTRPASRAIFDRPGGIQRGIGQIIPFDERRNECRKKVDEKYPLLPNTPAAKNFNEQQRLRRFSAYTKCEEAFEIEKILNGGVENSSHHVVYKNIPSGVTLPTEVIVKRTFHQTGVEGMALVGEIDTALMYGWVENGILAKNTQVGAGPLGSVQSSAYLSSDPAAMIDILQKRRPGADKWNTLNGIGAEPVTTTAVLVIKIIGAITAALTAAATLVAALRSTKAYAMSEARGFGTSAFSANQSDWMAGSNNPLGTTPGGVSMPLLLAGAAALFLLSDDK